MSEYDTVIEGATEDSGWFVVYDSPREKQWRRTMRHPTLQGQDIALVLRKRGDYPGWTGIRGGTDEHGVVHLYSDSDWSTE